MILRPDQTPVTGGVICVRIAKILSSIQQLIIILYLDTDCNKLGCSISTRVLLNDVRVIFFFQLMPQILAVK